MTRRPHILVVDDEPQIHRFLGPSLTASGFDVHAAASGAEALKKFSAFAIDAVILDLGLPDMDGKDVLNQIRRRSAVPVIILSARDRESEKISALDQGADDYINKPFGIGELLARVRSVLRRQATKPSEEQIQYQIGSVCIDTGVHRATRAGEPVHLTPKEFDLIVYLAKHVGRVLTHRQILTEIWGPAHGQDTQYLRVFIGQLRQKLESNPAEPQLILTEPGIGYRLFDGD